MQRKNSNPEEKELAPGQADFRALIEKNEHGILIVDKGNVVRFINPAVEVFLNRKATDILYQSFGFALIDGTQEISIYRKNGEIGTAEIRVDQTDWQGKECSLVSILDVTERKYAEKERLELEVQLQQAHKMETMGRMAGGIAHDLNNMLVPIMGYAEMEQKKFTPESKSFQNLGKIIKSATKAKDLVSKILAYSRKAKTKKMPVNLQTIVDGVLPLLSSTLPSGISIKTEIAPDLPKILADVSQIHQILFNLCVNAGQAMPEGGKLSLTLKDTGYRKFTTAYGKKAEGNYICLDVRDSGAGMDQQTLKRIFDPFFTTKEEGEGSGMGLSVVQGIVEQHQGTIDVESKPGKGTVFRICLPILVEKEETSKEQIPQIQLRGYERILFVDDDEQVCETVTSILKGLGYQVTSFTDSRMTFETFRQRPQDFDLVLTDYMMPHLSGIKLTEKLRAVRPDIPVVLCTAYSDVVSKNGLQKWGLNEMVLKPFHITSLSQTLRRVLDASKDDEPETRES